MTGTARRVCTCRRSRLLDRRLGIARERSCERLVAALRRDEGFETQACQHREAPPGRLQRGGEARSTVEPLHGQGDRGRFGEPKRIGRQAADASHDLSPRPSKST